MPSKPEMKNVIRDKVGFDSARHIETRVIRISSASTRVWRGLFLAARESSVQKGT